MGFRCLLPEWSDRRDGVDPCVAKRDLVSCGPQWRVTPVAIRLDRFSMIILMRRWACGVKLGREEFVQNRFAMPSIARNLL